MQDWERQAYQERIAELTESLQAMRHRAGQAEYRLMMETVRRENLEAYVLWRERL